MTNFTRHILLILLIKYSLPLFLKEMNDLWNTAPEVYEHFMKGHFVVRRRAGSFNGVATDMALEQTYNRDAKESHSGLTGITLDVKARTKWLYTKPISSEVSSQFKEMINVTHPDETHHHQEGKLEEVTRILKCIRESMTNPFKSNSTELLNIATGQTATERILHDLTHVEEIGKKAMDACHEGNSQKVCKVKLHTFADIQSKYKLPPCKENKQFLNEVTILKRLIQLKAVGHEVNLEETIGEFECAKAPPSMFEVNEQMRHGNKSVWLTALQKETSLEVRDSLPISNKRTAVVVDAMCFIQQHQFLDGETFREYQFRLHRALMCSLPNNTRSIHFPGDRYDHVESTKEVERQRRCSHKHVKEYEIN